MATISKRALLANTFGTFGYVSCLLQWLFIAMLYLPLILANDQIKHFLLPEKTEHIEPLVSTGPPSPILIGLAVIFTIFMIILTIVLIVRIPISIAKTGKAVTIKAAETVVPLLTHHPITKKKKRILTSGVVKGIKLAFVLLPFLLCFLSLTVETSLPVDVIIFASSFLATGSLVWFGAQYLTARLLRVPSDTLV